MNSLKFIKEFSKYTNEYTYSFEIFHKNRKFFHPGYKNFTYVYYYDIRERSLYLYGKRDSSKIYLHLSEIEKFVKFRIHFYKGAYMERKPGKIIKYFILQGFYKEDIAVHTIEKYWLKYRWNYRKNRIQPFKQELIAYIYHPKRMSFNV